MHNCCNRCHNNCKRDGTRKALYPFDKLHSVVEEIEKAREVNENYKNCLRDALKEIKKAISLRITATFFDTSGVLCHGFSDSIIEAIVENSYKIFTISDLMAHSFVSSLQLALTVLEVFAEVFEDITLYSSLYNLAVQMEPTYSSLMEYSIMDNIIMDYSEPYFEQVSDSYD